MHKRAMGSAGREHAGTCAERFAASQLASAGQSPDKGTTARVAVMPSLVRLAVQKSVTTCNGHIRGGVWGSGAVWPGGK